MTLDASGNLLVGTSSAINSSFRFNILTNSGNGGIVLRPNTDGTVPLIRALNAAASAAVAEIGTLSGSSFYISLNGTTALNIDSSSRTSIGYTTNPSTYMLDVNGTVRFSGALTGTSATFSSSVTANSGFISNNDSNTPAGFYKLKPDSTVATARWWKITSDNLVYGDFSIAQSSANSDASYINKLYFNASGAATFSSSIDIGNSVAVAVAAPSTHKVAILIGGVQYYLLASNV